MRRYFEIVVVGLSLVVSVGLFCRHFTQELSMGNCPKEQTFYQGSVKNGELWYYVWRFSGNPLSPKTTTHFKRLNLETGENLETPFQFSEPHVNSVWVDETLYVYTSDNIYEIVGDDMVTLPPTPFGKFWSNPFFQNGRLTVACRASHINGDVQLMHWNRGQWTKGRQILVPNPYQFFRDDVGERQKALQKVTGRAGPGTISPSRNSLVVLTGNDETHVIYGGNFITAHRKGIEFADQDLDCPSAIAPENAPHEFFGWESFPSRSVSPGQPGTPNSSSDIRISNDRLGLIFVSPESPPEIVRRFDDGHRENLFFYSNLGSQNSIDPFSAGKYLWVASDPKQEHSYAIIGDIRWGSATVSRIERHEIKRVHLVVPGFHQDYVNRWKRVCLRIVGVWLVPIVVLFTGAYWVSQRSKRELLDPRDLRLKQASIFQRAAAFSIDAGLFFAAIWMCQQIFVWSCIRDLHPVSTAELANLLALVETRIRSHQPQLSMFSDWIGVVFIDIGYHWFLLPNVFRTEILGVFISSIVVFGTIKVYFEGRFGVTPGKWLLGIRTVRTTLKSCGFARALVRNFLFCIDIPLLLTPIPATVSLMQTDGSQRLGDRVADTIVVKVRALAAR